MRHYKQTVALTDDAIETVIFVIGSSRADNQHFWKHPYRLRRRHLHGATQPGQQCVRLAI